MSDPEAQWREQLAAFVRDEGLPPAFLDVAQTHMKALADAVGERRRDGPLLVGLCGAQGSGKSTLAEVLALRWRLQGLGVAVLSLDDFYHPREERERLAREVHALLRTRGPPGTHDVALAIAIVDSLRRAGPTAHVAVPRFDKATDTRLAPALWSEHVGRPDIIIFEGWCVGARAEPSEGLARPINSLEAEEDTSGVWRRFVNDCLDGAYRAVFDQIDVLVLLEVPGFAAVLEWRLLQERKLRARLARAGRAGGMRDEEVARFVMHYERLTRHILEEMPGRADFLLKLDAEHRIETVKERATP